MAEKPTFNEYLDEVLHELEFSSADAGRRVHEQNLQSALIDLQKSEIWKALENELDEMQARYLGGRSGLLFSSKSAIGEIGIVAKPFESTMLKVYRTNVIFNRDYPAAARNAIPFGEIYDRIDDLLRARLVCRYMDGPKFVCEELRKRCEILGVEFKVRTHNTPAGYYAWHFYFRVPVSFIEGKRVVDRLLWVEIQVSTQLAEVITSLTHSVYEARRVGEVPKDGWHWLPGSPEFKSAYLGHGLHLLEGVIQGFRDDVLGSAEAAVDQPDVNAEESKE